MNHGLNIFIIHLNEKINLRTFVNKIKMPQKAFVSYSLPICRTSKLHMMHYMNTFVHFDRSFNFEKYFIDMYEEKN